LSERYRYIFGPVPSRRLGLSLGVDIIPLKTCSYDCIYCQLGRTDHKTVERRSYVPAGEVLDELDRILSSGLHADYITFSGSGEPTLNSDIGSMISSIKRMTDIPVAVLTNGSLLHDPDVRASLRGADLVVPSLDAGNGRTFKRVNRPHRSIGFDEMVRGLADFRREFEGMYWLEIFLVDGINTSDGDLREIRDLVGEIGPDRVQLNTAVRPPAEGYVREVPPEEMERIRELIGHGAEVIAAYRSVASSRSHAAERDEILAMLLRRPCTLEDISEALGLHRNQVSKHLAYLKESGAIGEVRQGGKTYFVAVHKDRM